MDIRGDFARALRNPSPSGIPLEGPHEEIKAAGVNIVDIRPHVAAIGAAIGSSMGDLRLTRGTKPDGTSLLGLSIEGDKLPLVNPLRWPVHGWWLISDRLLVATFPLESDNPDIEVFGAYPVLYSTARQQALAEGIDPTILEAIEASGTNIDDERVMSPTGTINMYIDPSRNLLYFSFGFDEIPPESERGSYEAAVATLVVMAVAADLMSADPAIVDTTPRARRLVSKQQRRYGFASERTTTINLPGLRYEHGHWQAKTGAGVAWHMVRGHWRTLKHPKYRKQRRVWVRPHSKGSADLGTVSHHYTIDSRSAGEQATHTQKPPTQMVGEPNTTQQRRTT